MAIPYPNSTDPLVFSATLPAGNTDTSNAPLGGQQASPFTTTAPSGSMSLAFVIFAYPNGNSDAGGNPLPSPQTPLVEVQTGGGPWQMLQVTTSTGGAPLSLGDPVNMFIVDYTMAKPDPNGVVQIAFQQNNAPFDQLAWDIRFTINDGVTGTATLPSTGVTFAVDPANALAPWLAVPSQVYGASPPTIDFGAAEANLTLSGTLAGASRQLIAGKTYPLLNVPVGNYGTGPLNVSGFPSGNPAQPLTTQTINGMTLTLAGQVPFTVAPGRAVTTSLQGSFTSPPGGQTASAATTATFTLQSNDISGTIPHYNTISLNATAGNFEIIFVLDLSGSMGTTDAGNPPESRWASLHDSVDAIVNQMPQFTSANDTLGAVLYPNSDGVTGAQILLPPGPFNTTNITKLITALGNVNPVDSTPMAGTPTNPNGVSGGIYAAAGKPSDLSDFGIFSHSADQSYLRNFRWMVLMSDGMSNVGDDPRSIQPTYFNKENDPSSKNVQAITIGYGDPNGGQLDPDTLRAVANASMGTTSMAPPNYFPALPGGTVSNQLLMTFEKTIAGALGLNFAADPDATLAEGVAENRHTVIVTDYDNSASFLVCCESPRDGNLLQVELISPLGELITADIVEKFEMTFSETALSKVFNANPATLINTDGSPRYGTWTIVVSRGRVLEPALQYAYSVAVDSNLSLCVSSTSPANYAGNGIEITAALSLHGRPISGAHVTAVIAGSGQGFNNWLASQTVTQAEYDAALRSLEAKGLHDLQALFVKTTALAAKGIVFPGVGGSVVQTLVQEPKHGTYRTTFSSTRQPGTYQFLVSATGQDDKGNLFTRQQTWTTVVTVQPDAASTIVSITYQVVSGQMQATLQVWPQDQFGNVFLTDPAISKAIQVLLAGGAVASGPLKWNLDASYTQVFTYPLTATPVISIVIGGQEIGSKIAPPDFGKMLFVNEVVRFTQGREAEPGHTDPSQALGDPSRKPLTDFLSLGRLGQAAFDVKGKVIQAKEVTVFVALGTDLCAYAVDVLPVQTGVGWVEVGQSRGITETLSLVPKKYVPPDTKGWYIEVEGRLAGEAFDVKIPLEGKLHAPVDPLARIGSKGIAQVRVRDLSNHLAGVSILGIGFST